MKVLCIQNGKEVQDIYVENTILLRIHNVHIKPSSRVLVEKMNAFTVHL